MVSFVQAEMYHTQLEFQSLLMVTDLYDFRQQSRPLDEGGVNYEQLYVLKTDIMVIYKAIILSSVGRSHLSVMIHD